MKVSLKNFKLLRVFTRSIEGGAKPADKCQMIINYKWEQEKINKSVYEYEQLCHLASIEKTKY